MSFDVQKHGPMLAVLSVAVYLGWPPAEREDYGSGPVKAKTVRWKVSDLAQPSLPPTPSRDPFAEVLIDPTDDKTLVSTEGVPAKPAEPAGPTKDDLAAGLKLDGVAVAKSSRWAVINGRVRQEGEQVKIIGLRDQFATIDRIEAERVIVSIDGLSVPLKQTSGRHSNATSRLDQTPESSQESDKAENENSTSVPAKSSASKNQNEATPAGMQWLSEAFKLRS